MASRLSFPHPIQGLSYIYNVNAQVGPLKTNPNLPDDVELVQFLIRENLKRGGVGSSVFNQVPTLTRRMDVVTAYWILRMQHDNSGSFAVDGIVSPAHGVSYGNHFWTIVGLNDEYKTLFGDAGLAAIPNHPDLSASLRQSLQGGGQPAAGSSPSSSSQRRPGT